ncbi:phage baseplate protein [uncultured Megasphaera sp.]|jgi:hypothetical protein|uniref:phage baseplate protein n=1 Tax=uncultured Megasphaera sp. TaxID=165188 RepID=UPI0025876DAF|nr:hypothetical protein [uncultured Megasphaera sp.]
MTIPSIDSFSNYNKYKSEAGYTKQADMMRYLANQNDCLTALTQALLWQPETAYEVGKVIQSPTMPTGVRARVTQAGTSGQAEPAWTDAGTTVTDGTITYTMESLDYAALIAAATSSLQATMTEAIATAKKEALLEAHPVGSYYWSNDSTDPGTLFGGTWEALPAGYGLVAQGTATAEDGSTLTFTAGNKYGEFKHQLTVGELPYIEKIPVWSDYADPNKALLGHATDGSGNTSINDYGVGPVNGMNVGSRTFTLSVSLPGNGKAHDNISPCLAAYAWKRTA